MATFSAHCNVDLYTINFQLTRQIFFLIIIFLFKILYDSSLSLSPFIPNSLVESFKRYKEILSGLIPFDK